MYNFGREVFPLMTETPGNKVLWLEFLKIFTRALVQINLYRPDHPQVKQALQDGEALLRRIHSENSGDFSLTMAAGSLLANGLPLITTDKLPNSIKNLFARFRVQTITFVQGAAGSDLLALCQMQAHKGDGAAFLRERGITKITLNVDVYAKVDPSAAQAPNLPAADETTGTAAPAPQAPAAPEERIAEQIYTQGLETALSTVVSRATENPEERKAIMDLLTAKFKEQLATEVERAVETVRREKKKVENDMVRTESVMTSMAEGVVVVDKNGNILMMNPQAEAISGKPLAELSGKKISDLHQSENHVISLAKQLSSEDKADVSNEIVKTGSAELAETVKKATAVIQNEDGKIVGSVSIPTDVVKLKQMEQLQKDFIANMTHELRSPLTSIKAALEILGHEASKPGDPSRSILNTAIRNTERLNSIITDILDFSKLQSGKLIFHQENTPADEITREAVESMKAWATSKGVALSARTELQIPYVYADKRRTVQVLINLISNAIKFTPQGGSIEVSADAGRDALANFVFFSVRDTGCGIKKEDQSKIFEKFVQIASGEKVGGTGLGLAITKAMVIMQGGKITLDSEPGRGSTFRVSLPVYKGQIDQPVFEQVTASAPEDKSWWKKLIGI